MAGWVLVWSRRDAPPDAARWERSVAIAQRYGGTFTQHRVGRALLGAWRRENGEFPASGRITSVADAHVAWIGQCLEDEGDDTPRSQAVLAANRFDATAAAALNGPFAAAVVRAVPFEVRVITDRHRQYPVYVHRGIDVSVASTELRCLVPWLHRAELDREAVDMLLRCGELIDRQTLLKGVDILPPASVVTDAEQGIAEQRYWAMRSHNSREAPASATELAHYLKRGVRRIESVTEAPGITLSGGLDSRIILDLCEHPERVPSFTWGLPGCRDIVRATEFAALVGSEHVVKHWDPAAFPPLWARGVDLTGGSCGIDAMFMLPFVPLLASSCNVVFNGLAGDVILGGNWLKRSWLHEQHIEVLGRSVWRWRVPLSQDLLVDRLTARRPDMPCAGDRWVASIAARPGAQPVERLNDWLVENRIFRTTNCGTMLLRGGVESHAPFFDRDFIDALTRVDQDRKLKHRLYLEVLASVAPRAASVAWQRTNIKPSRGYYANLAAMAFHRLATKACAPIGYTPFRDLQVADFAGWLRGPLRSAVEEVVLSRSLRERDLVVPEVVEEMWKEHLQGSNHSRQLGVLIAVELFARLADGCVQ
jgi:asparagine synthase (glutamine-hydrolysing)